MVVDVIVAGVVVVVDAVVVVVVGGGKVVEGGTVLEVADGQGVVTETIKPVVLVTDVHDDLIKVHRQ